MGAAPKAGATGPTGDGTRTNPNPNLSPESGDVPPLNLTAPGLRRRMACWLYEGMILFGVIFVAGYLFSALSQARHGLQHRTELQAFVFVVMGIYFVYCWSKGQTLPMKTWHIRVVDRSGKTVSQARALLRYCLCWLWFAPVLAAVAPFGLSGGEITVLVTGWVVVWALLSRFHPQRQFLHDVLAGTRLIDAKPTPAAKPLQP